MTFHALDQVRIKPEFAGEWWAKDIKDQRGVVERNNGTTVTIQFRGHKGPETTVELDKVELIT